MSRVSLAGFAPSANEVLEELTRIIARFGGDMAGGTPAGERHSGLESLARTMLDERASRRKLLGDDLPCEPVWDILLDLFVHCERGRAVSVSSACLAANLPTTSALRLIKGMEQRGLIVRISDPSDGRRHFVHITDDTQRAMRAHLSRWYGQDFVRRAYRATEG